jgi:hypothetical protein
MKEELDGGSNGISWLISRHPQLGRLYARNRDSVSISFDLIYILKPVLASLGEEVRK